MRAGRASTRRRLAVVGLTVTALAVSSAPAALAAPGDWTQLSQASSSTVYPEIGNINEPTVARFGSSLQVIWPARTGSNSDGYFTAILDGAGTVTTPSTQIISNWATVTDDPTLISLGGQRFLTFSGLQSTTTGAPFTSGAQYFATSGDGISWTMGSGTLSETTSAYGSYGSDAVDNAGTPVWVGNAGTTTGIRWHSGISPTDPAPAGSDGRFLLDGCCAYNAAVARDEATGAVFGAFYSNSSATTENGIQVGQILPTQGAFAQAPGSVTIRDGAADSEDPSQQVALASRPGGGVYVAYAVGYPSATTIRLLQVGTSNTIDVPGSANAEHISLAGGPDGRMWITWVSGNRLKVVHTNTAVTRFGATGAWGAPRGTDTMWKTTSSAAGGALDVVVTATTQSKINVWHTQVNRTLSLAASPVNPRRAGNVTFTVTDAGDPVAGAQVKIGGRTGMTNAAGKVTLRAPSARGRAKATASKAGYHPGTTSIRVR